MSRFVAFSNWKAFFSETWFSGFRTIFGGSTFRRFAFFLDRYTNHAKFDLIFQMIVTRNVSGPARLSCCQSMTRAGTSSRPWQGPRSCIRWFLTQPVTKVWWKFRNADIACFIFSPTAAFFRGARLRQIILALQNTLWCGGFTQTGMSKAKMKMCSKILTRKYGLPFPNMISLMMIATATPKQIVNLSA